MYYTMLYEDNEVICLIYLFDDFIYNITEIDCAAYQNTWILDEYKFIGVYPFFLVVVQFCCTDVSEVVFHI